MEPLCKSLGIPFEQSHRAESDADACAKVMLKCLDKLQVDSFEGLEHKINIRRGFYNGGLHNGQKSLATTIGKAKNTPTQSILPILTRTTISMVKKCCLLAR